MRVNLYLQMMHQKDFRKKQALDKRAHLSQRDAWYRKRCQHRWSQGKNNLRSVVALPQVAPAQ